MKLTFRPGIFETNSSMTHTLIIGSRNDFEKWRNGDLYWWGDPYMDFPRFVTKEEKEKLIKEQKCYENDFQTYAYYISEESDEYGDYCSLETDSGIFKSPSGDEMEWFSAYGYDY